MQNNTSESDSTDTLRKSHTQQKNGLQIKVKNTLRMRHIEIVTICFSIVAVVMLGLSIASHFVIRDRVASFHERETVDASKEKDDSEDNIESEDTDEPDEYDDTDTDDEYDDPYNWNNDNDLDYEE